MQDSPLGIAANLPSSARLQLGVVDGDTIIFKTLPAEGSLTLGRGDDCDVRVDNRSVSRRHAILHVGTPMRLAIEDLGSANGTFVAEMRATVGTVGMLAQRRLCNERADIAVGERFNLGTATFAVRRARFAAAEVSAARGAHPGGAPGGVILRDPAMRALYEQATRAARGQMSVLIVGESGVGKEVLARTVHARSRRAEQPCLEINCAALPEAALESQLFGPEGSALPGAGQAKAGLLEAADGGTIFLDEVAELPLSLQVKLLRALEEKAVREGGRAPRRIDVRCVAATSRDLKAEVARGAFREDLYSRLSGVSFVIPPLRHRVSEIAPLAKLFLCAACDQLDQASVPRLSPAVLSMLQSHPWPGNVRELLCVIERAAVLCGGEDVLPTELPACLLAGSTLPNASALAAKVRSESGGAAGQGAARRSRKTS